MDYHGAVVDVPKLRNLGKMTIMTNDSVRSELRRALVTSNIVTFLFFELRKK